MSNTNVERDPLSDELIRDTKKMTSALVAWGTKWSGDRCNRVRPSPAQEAEIVSVLSDFQKKISELK